MNTRPLIGISVGDPAGIGPEITAKALAIPDVYEWCRPLVVAETAMMRNAAAFSGLDLPVHPVEGPEEGRYVHGTMDVLDLKNIDGDAIVHKRVSAACGQACYDYIAKVIELAMAGRIDATVTGPIHKEAIAAAGIKHAGHTEIYLTDAKPLEPGVLVKGSDSRNLLNVAVSRSRGKVILIGEIEYFRNRAKGSPVVSLLERMSM